MRETATGNYADKWGVEISPAPLSAVLVNTAKALMELHPVKHSHESKLRIEGAGGSLVFNVIGTQTEIPVVALGSEIHPPNHIIG